MPRVFIVLLLAAFTATGFAQKQDVKYTVRADEIQKEIWSNPSSPFKLTQVPAEMNNESQVVEIIDYYIRVEKLQEANNAIQGPYTLVMGGEYPILYYNARLQLDEHVGVEYISANGAPSFKESNNDDGDIVLELTQK